MNSSLDSSPPQKKRRIGLYNVEDSDFGDRLDGNAIGNSDSQAFPPASNRPATQRNDTCNPSLDRETLCAILGQSLSDDEVFSLAETSGGDIERAINLFLDGTWKRPRKSITVLRETAEDPSKKRKQGHEDKGLSLCATESSLLGKMPNKRFIGAFGAEGWSTTSGTDLVSYGEKVRIERQKLQVPSAASRRGKSKKGSSAAPVFGRRKSQDIVVRFTNSQGREVGRLSQDTAAFVSTLIDQQICHFEAQCVYAPEVLKTNETIYLQIRAYFLKSAFTASKLFKSDTGRPVDVFAQQETEEEKELRLRQLAIVKLFDRIGLEPTQSENEKMKRAEIVRAVETADQNFGKTSSSIGNTGEEEQEDGKELEQDQLDALYKKAQSFDFSAPEAEPASTFNLELRPYQKQALHWLLKKEKNELSRDNESMHPLWEEYSWPVADEDGKPLVQVEGLEKFYINPYAGQLSLKFPRQEQNCKGGILADEMGLGKTIEMMSLIHTHRPKVEAHSRQSALSLLQSKPLEVEFAPATTLVIAPMSLLAQWEAEAEASSKPGTMKTLIYYGGGKENLHALCTGDSAATAPSVIITSYGTVLSEFTQLAEKRTNRAESGGVYSVKFFRIILDEAHSIKNRSSKTARACFELEAEHRWVLTGTPIVNRLEDLFSLVRFLRVEPWSNFSFWRTFITVPFESKDFIRALDVVQTVLEPLVLRRTKEMKLPDGSALVSLPPKEVKIEEITLSDKEREVYDHIFNRVRQTFNKGMETGTLLKSYTTLFAQILRLRQSCCHPILVRRKEIVSDEMEAEAQRDAETGFADDMDLDVLIDRFSAESVGDSTVYEAHILKQIQEESENECPFCFDIIKDLTVTGCFHASCKTCIIEYIDYQRKHNNTPKCVSCRKPIDERDLFEVVREDSINLTELNSISTPSLKLRRINQHSSAKIDALISKIKGFRRAGDLSKMVVFSQFTSFLDLIERHLSRENLKFVRFDGTMAQQARAAVVSAFKAHPNDGMIMLISLRAGGVGLNLTEAKKVFMMDPWWSFAVEAQAIDRVHRMGQDQKVEVYRFVVKDSVEERMVNKIQARKKFIASSLGMMDDHEKKQQRIEDIKDLLS